MVCFLQLEGSAYAALERQEAAVIPGWNRVPADPCMEVVQVQATFQIEDSAQPPRTSERDVATHLPSPSSSCAVDLPCDTSGVEAKSGHLGRDRIVARDVIHSHTTANRA